MDGPTSADPELLALIPGWAKITELSQVFTLEGWRTRADGVSVKVRIELFDAGPAEQPYRWHVVATDEEGRMATGNPESTLGLALQMVNWNDLDKAD